MNARIEKMVRNVFENDIYPKARETEYDKLDLLLPDLVRNTKRLCKYMLNQEVYIADDALFAGQTRFTKCPYPSDVFRRTGHARFGELLDELYCKQIDNLVSFEWQHSTPNYENIINYGIDGLLERIEKSAKLHAGDEKKSEFLYCCKMLCETIIKRAEQFVDKCRELAKGCDSEARRAELTKMADALSKVPKKPAESFYEAVFAIYFTFDFLTDSIGTIDRYLYRFYKNDIDKKLITKENAKEYLQEFFVRIQGSNRGENIPSNRFTRGAENHFAIGGYALDGEDGFNELSALIVEAIMETPLYVPQISLRWTKKTPFEILKKLMDYERHDPNKRIAFVNDEPRIEGFINNAGLTREQAYRYTMVGCNEPAIPGGIWLGGATINIVRSLTDTLYGRRDEVLAAKTFDDFYKIYKEELHKDLAQTIDWGNKFNYARSKDVNVLSSLMLDECIENGTSVTEGGALGITGANVMGMTNLIDSISIIKQFVFDEKTVSFEELLTALDKNWEGYEDLRAVILKKGKFFGNGYELSDEVARRLTTDMHAYLCDKKSSFGKRYLLGNLTGYNEHYTWFGALTKATPDGRFEGEPLSLGIGQSGGKDREGLSALLSSIAQYDPKRIFTGPSVTNINLDSALIYNDDNFEKTAKMIETYFKMGGLHVQINTVLREDLLEAQKTPEKYKSLRVRVSGFSDYFTNLNEALQENIIERTKIDC